MGSKNKEVTFGTRVRVCCICGKGWCPAPASSGGALGTVVDIEHDKVTVEFDEPVQTPLGENGNTFEFPRTFVMKVDDTE